MRAKCRAHRCFAPILFLHTPDCRCRRVLHLDPVRALARTRIIFEPSPCAAEAVARTRPRQENSQASIPLAVRRCRELTHFWMFKVARKICSPVSLVTGRDGVCELMCCSTPLDGGENSNEDIDLHPYLRF